MTDNQKIELQRWWMGQLRDITFKVMEKERKRQEKAKKKRASILADLEIEKRSDIDDLYAFDAITSKQRDRLVDLFEKAEEPDSMYQAKVDLLQDAYEEAQMIMRDLGQEV